IVEVMNFITGEPADFLIISGDDIITLPMVLAGGAGVISVIGQGFPKEFSSMVQMGLDRKADQAYEIHYKLTEIINLIFAEGNPAGIKSVFDALQLAQPSVRLPLVEASADLRQKIASCVNSLR